MLNEELIRKVIGHIEVNNRWDQGTWGGLTEDMFELDTDGYARVRPDAFDTVPVYTINDEFVLIDVGVAMEGVCGTRFCFAGHTVLQAGDKILLDKDTGDSVRCLDSEGNIHLIEQRAQQLLGLDQAQANALFDSDAGYGDLVQYKELVTRKTGVTFE